MTNVVANEVTLKDKFDTLNTLEAQGAWLGKKYRSIVNSDRKAITEFDLPLGNVMVALRQEGGKQITKGRLQDCGIANVAKQRRSEAEFLARNWSNPVMQELVESKRFSSVQTLLREFKKLTNEKQPVVKTAEQLVEELFKGMEKFDISQADLQAALVAKLASAPATEADNTQSEAA
jgi:Glu-tRNA(Gln) amidotransferase subunit E-like FAD-binding protein